MTEMYWDGDAWAVQIGNKFWLGLTMQEAQDMLRRWLYDILLRSAA